MRRKLIRDISASGLQVIFNQVAGATIFLILSYLLEKKDYGEFNWSMAFLTFIITILGLRLEQIVVRRIAAGEDATKLLTLFFAHTLFTGLFFYVLLAVATLIFPAFFRTHSLLHILAISQLLSFFSSPFRQVANGLEHFKVLAWMSSIANLIRAAWLIVALCTRNLSINQLILIYIISSFVELIFCMMIARTQLGAIVKPGYGIKDYFILIRESLPQAAMVFLNASIARIDWILMGLFAGSIATAEYSFAYRVFELSPLPMLIIAPVLLSRFSRFFSNFTKSGLLNHKTELGFLIRMEMIAATIIPLLLNLVWAPLVDSITGNKYGAVNSTTFLVLSFCIPFLYLNNILWSVHFAQNQLKMILRITLLTFFIILIGDLFLIPIYSAKGAASVYLFATMIEYINYMRSSFLRKIRDTWTSPLICILSAFVSGYLSCLLVNSVYGRIAIALSTFILLLLATRQLKKSDWKYILQLTSVQ